MRKKNLLQSFCELIYKMLVLNFLFLLGTILGGIVFSIIPSSISIFKLINFTNESSNENTRAVFKLWWSEYKKNLKQYWLVSLIFVTIFIITIVDLFFFTLPDKNFNLIKNLFFLFLIFAIFFVALIFSYITSHYEKINLKEKIKNTICLFLASLIEMIFLGTVFVFMILLVNYFFIGIVFLLGFGFIFIVTDFVLAKILSGKNLYNLFKNFI